MHIHAKPDPKHCQKDGPENSRYQRAQKTHAQKATLNENDYSVHSPRFQLNNQWSSPSKVGTN